MSTQVIADPRKTTPDAKPPLKIYPADEVHAENGVEANLPPVNPESLPENSENSPAPYYNPHNARSKPIDNSAFLLAKQGRFMDLMTIVPLKLWEVVGKDTSESSPMTFTLDLRGFKLNSGWDKVDVVRLSPDNYFVALANGKGYFEKIFLGDQAREIFNEMLNKQKLNARDPSLY